MKQKYLILFFIMILSMLCFFYFSTNSIKTKIAKIGTYDRAIKKDQDKLNSAKVLNEQLQEVSKVIMQSMTTEKDYTPEETNEFVKKLATLADKYKIAVTSLFPKVVSSGGRNLVEQQYTMILNCSFVQMGEFLSQLESFDHIIKIKTLDVSPIKLEKKGGSTSEDASTRYRVTIELSTFKIIKEA
ncbi:MAG: hypothetical protein DRH79_03960 [Candidatus Cloacimonadota bacterium]|nr:MAG: hypothetical protein DRH79_03960 [Candidatus Cloacimonadota bacterium]